MRRKKRSILLPLILIAFIASIVYLAQSPYFERQSPEIVADKTIYWNRVDPLQVTVTDNEAIKEYKAILSDDEKVVGEVSKQLKKPVDEAVIEIEYPRLGFSYNKKEFTLEISAVDTSYWNFFSGNKAEKTIHVIVDDIKPTVSVLANSYSIRRGGSGLVIFRAFDENLVDLHIETSYGKIFDVIPFYKQEYYIALLAWPVPVDSFSAHIVATDIAGNETKRRIPYYLTNRQYRTSTINVSDSFIDNQITDLARQYPAFDSIDGGVDLFVAVNETLREQNVELIDKVSTIDDFTMIDDWSIDPFVPLRGGAVQAGFGDHRIYKYDSKRVSDSYHLGIDYASVRNADIVMSNPGQVRYARFNGLYGHMPVVDHGLGLYSLYAHCSAVYVQEGDYVQAGEKIAETGVSGLAFGDHLHFGISVQGVEVRPEEWMDRNWIKNNIDDVIKKAREMIDIQTR